MTKKIDRPLTYSEKERQKERGTARREAKARLRQAQELFKEKPTQGTKLLE